MKECALTKKQLIFFMVVYISLVSVLLIFTPFTHSEANILYSENFTLESLITKKFYVIFKDEWWLRLPFFSISLGTIYLYLNLLNDYFSKYNKYYNLTLSIFLATPGIFISFILVNYATIPIFLTLLFIYSYKKDFIILEIISLVLLFFTHSAQFVVYIAVAIYSFKNRQWWLFAFSVILVLFVSVEQKYAIDGIPKGHLIQLMGIYAAIFSPLLFLSTIYALYKTAINGNKDILWYIAVTAFSLSILLSIRQKVKITDFSPYFIIATPLILTIFKNSVEVRLKEFRKNYYIVCNIIIIVLLLETLLVVLHYPLYKFNPNNSWLIDKSIYEIPKISKIIKNSNQNCKRDISNKEKSLYKYYQIKKCN